MSRETPALGPGRKSVYALGDVTINMALTSMSMIYTAVFLTQVAELRPVLAGLIPLIGRFVDAFSDPLMGRISDNTHWRLGRRRPYFLLGAVPFGVTFALLWVDAPFASQALRFVFYAGVYCFMSLAMTMLSVPYLAIQPEMATSYDERTSINTYRTVGSLVGVVAAVVIEEVAIALGDGAPDFAAAGLLYGVLVTVPWVAVFAVTFERQKYQNREANTGFVEAMRYVFAHSTFTRLTLLYIMGRIAMDLAGLLIRLYTGFWLLRPGDFVPVMLLFLGSTALALPFWLRFSEGRDKSRVFIVGSVWWMLCSASLMLIQPDSPRWIIFLFVPFVGVGYAVVDLMPWSMVGEVIDEDDLETGERREGLYNGVFTFIRKLGGALGVFLVMSLLDLAGFQKGETQTETARQAIRFTTAFAPAFFLALAVWFARGYPLTRAVHQRIRIELDRRDNS